MKRILLALAALLALATPAAAQVAPVPGPGPIPCAYTSCTVVTLTMSGNGAASLSPLMATGTIFTGGGTTATFPYIFVQPTAASARTDWSNNGTVFGINTATGFTGNFLDFGVNGGASVFKVT